MPASLCSESPFETKIDKAQCQHALVCIDFCKEVHMHEDLWKVQKIISAALELKVSHGVLFSACLLQEANVRLEVALLLLAR